MLHWKEWTQLRLFDVATRLLLAGMSLLGLVSRSELQTPP